VSCSLSHVPFPTSGTYLFHPSHYRHRYDLRQSGWSPCSVTSFLLGSPVMSPSRLLGPAVFVVFHMCLACLVLPTRSAMPSLTFLVGMALSPLSLLPMLLLPRLPTVMTKFSFRVSHTALLCFCVMVMLWCHSRARVFVIFPPPPPLLLIALNLPCMLAAVADVLLGVINSVLPLLLLRQRTSCFLPLVWLPWILACTLHFG
jgi:hypothetical protein